MALCCRVPIVKLLATPPPAYTLHPCPPHMHASRPLHSTAVTSLTEKRTPREPFKCVTSNCESA